MEKINHNISTFFLIVILVFAAYLRLYNVSGYMTFLGDEGRDALVVKRMIVDHKLTLLGPTASVGGFFMGPIYYYFMAPFLWLYHLDPTGPAVMVALFGVATVYLVYKAGKEFFHEYVGIVASSLYALSPLVISHSRSSWNPNLVPFFAIVLIYYLMSIKAHGLWHNMIWVGIALGIGLQLHYLFLFLIITTVVWFLIVGRSLRFTRYYALGFLGFLIGYSLFLAFELRHGFPNTQAIIRFVFEGKDTGFSFMQFFQNILDVSFRSFGRLLYRLPDGGLWDVTPAWQKTAWVIGVRTTILVSIGILVSQKKKIASMLLLIWLIVPLMLFGFYRKAIYDYYFGIFFPLPFLGLGVILWQLQRIRIGALLAVVIWASLLYFNWQGRPMRYPPNNQLAQTKRIAQVAYELTDGRPYNFALIADRNSDHGFRYFFEIWGNPPVVIENQDLDPDRRSVTDQLIVICDNPTCQPLGHPLWEIAGFGRAEIVGSWDVPYVRIFKLVHYQERI